VLFWAMIAAAAVGLLLRLLDLFLSNSQKAWLEDKALHLWHWLAVAKKRSLLDWLRRHYRWLVWAAILSVIVYLGWIIRDAALRGAGADASLVLEGLIMTGLSVWFGLKIIRLTLRSSSLPIAFLRATLFVLLAFTPFLLLAAVVTFFQEPILSSLVTSQPTLGIALLQLLFISAYIFSIHFLAISLMFWGMIAIPLALIYVITVVLFVSEFVVRRLVEHPTALVAASAVFGAAAVFLKMFS